MAEKIIRKKRRRFKHLRREEVAEVVTAMDRTEGRTLEKVKGIARKAGCSVATCYRLYGESRIEALGPSGQRREERHVSAVLTPRETFRKRNSSGNARKAEKAAGFLRLVSDYVREDRMLRTLEEAWHAIRGAGYSGPSVCVKTLYSYCREGLLDGIRPVDLPRRKAWKTRQKWKTYTDRKARGTPVSERPEEIGSRKTFGHWEEVPQRDVRQRFGVLALEGEGAAALGQDLLRTSLPFRGQRKQRELQRADTEIREEGNGHREDRPERDGEDQPEDQRQAERNPRLGKRGVFLREHALEGRDTCGGHVPP